jgi:catechol 2,3-dioxygenase
MSYNIHPNTSIGEVKLKVSNLERSIKFYQDTIGFKVLKQTAHTVNLTVDGQNSLLMLEEIPKAVTLPGRSTTGLYHFAILLPTRKDLSVSLRKLIDSGIHIGQADHFVSEALYISDPDQNGIEIYQDRPKDSWKRNEQGEYIMGGDSIDMDGLLAEAEDQPWSGLPSQTIIGHIHLHVQDLQQSKEFYCRLLGYDIAAVLEKEMHALFISAGGYHHHIGLNIWAGAGAPEPPPNATGLSYYTMVIPDIETYLIHLKNVGISVQEQDGAWFMTDPSGVRIKMITE